MKDINRLALARLKRWLAKVVREMRRRIRDAEAFNLFRSLDSVPRDHEAERVVLWMALRTQRFLKAGDLETTDWCLCELNAYIKRVDPESGGMG